MRLAFAVVISVAVVARPASAEDKKQAERYFRAGEKAYQAQNFVGAIANFEQAYKLYAIPEIAFSAAQAYRRQYRIDGEASSVARAIELYRAYLDKVKTGGRVADAADALGEMQHELDKLIKSGVKVSAALAAEHTQLGVNVTLGSAAVTSGVREVEDRAVDAPQITVTIDGNPAAPFTLVNVAPGKHAIHVDAPGFVARDRDETAVQGASALVDITLDPKPAALAITAEGGARIALDGRALGTAPHAAFEVVAGHHLLTVAHRGRQPLARELSLANGERFDVTAPLPFTGQRRALPWVFGGAGVVAIGATVTGIVAALADRDASRIYDAAHGPGDLGAADQHRYDVLVSRRDNFRTATFVAGGLAVVGAAVGFGMYLFDDPSPDAVHLAPVSPSGGAGATVGGRF